MFQFEYLNLQKMSSQPEFLNRLGEFAAHLPPDYSYALETRNPKYLDRAYFEHLGRHGLSPVLLQGYWMPPVTSVYEKWRTSISQHSTVVIRLLGPDRKGIEEQTDKKWDQIVAPKDEELPEIAQVMRDLVSQGVDVYLNVNNHYEGSAPLTIRRIEGLL
jgi:uncharacterized protein YecE (DUF72 family)